MRKLLYLFLLFTSITLGQTIKNYFEPPKGYERELLNDYSHWIIDQPIIVGETVLTYNKYPVSGLNNVYVAKFDYDIGKKNLHQCADAAIYLNAKYHYSTGNLHNIKYHFNNGTPYYFSTYKENILPKYYGDKQKFINKKPSSNKRKIDGYLEIIWMYAGSYSLEKYDTYQVNINDIQPGDIFIYGGFPGHVVSVVDVIVNKNGNKKFMLAQSYMPAQDQHILLNPRKEFSVWHDLVSNENEIITNGGNFNKTQLRRFINLKNER
jgi:hypothetical protein|tara:strand:- start:465 stop:1259 length:795 start_codon:yes stop_codon:yes gene_type:complete